MDDLGNQDLKAHDYLLDRFMDQKFTLEESGQPKEQIQRLLDQGIIIENNGLYQIRLASVLGETKIKFNMGFSDDKQENDKKTTN